MSNQHPLSAEILKSCLEKSITMKQFQDEASYFTMSGTSQAAAVTSGVATLMLQADPSLTPDQVKCRLMASAPTPGLISNGGQESPPSVNQ